MKRFVICLLLLAFVVGVSAVGTVSVTRHAEALLDALKQTEALLQAQNTQAAQAQAKRTQQIWERGSLSFFVFLDHEVFSELDVLLPMLADYLASDAKDASQQLLRCEGILKDVIAHQQITLGNVF